jgi:acyl-CoA synthetase (AMP-forming)/AMP-acid ligase II
VTQLSPACTTQTASAPSASGTISAASAFDNAILAAWRQTLARRGEQPAILDDSGRVLRRFSEIETEAGEMAASLSGLTAHSVIALQLGNSPLWPAVLLALFRRGLVPLPLGSHMEAAELNAALQTCRASALLTAVSGNLRLEPCSFAGEASREWPAPAPDLLKLTSGTTSAPRAVRFRAHQLLADCENICSSMGIGEADVNYAVIPISHSYGFSNLLTPLLCRGVTMAVSEDRMPRAIVSGLAATGATVFPGMPVFFDKLSALDQPSPCPALRLCISAGAALPPSVAAAFTARFGLKVHTFYGSSECGGIGYDASTEAAYEEGYAGRPLDGVRVEPLAVDGDSGRVEVRGEAVGDGYFPDGDPSTLGGGCFVPGDLIRWTERGMYISGRCSDFINVAGRKLNPAELEAEIASFPGVRQAVVFGVPSALRGEEPIACVAGDQIVRAELQRLCQEKLSQWQRPRDFWIVAEIPANDRGKISRRALAEQYLAWRSLPATAGKQPED